MASETTEVIMTLDGTLLSADAEPTAECQRCEREMPEHLVAYESMCWKCFQKAGIVDEAANEVAYALDDVERIKAELAEAIDALKAARKHERKVIAKYGPNR